MRDANISPLLGRMKEINVYLSPTTCIDYFSSENATHIAFVFCPVANTSLTGNRFGGDLLLKNGYDVVSFKVVDADWFQKIPQSVLEFLRKLGSDPRYHRRVAYGSSMGGFGAIVFSKILNVQAVLAFSPQYSIRDNFDKRWVRYAQKIDWIHTISPDSINPGCRYKIVYDNTDLDKTHVDLIEGCIPRNYLNRIPVPFSGHSSIHFFSDLGILKSFVLEALSSSAPTVFAHRTYRDKSKVYQFNKSLRLLGRKRAVWALSAVDRAIDLAPSDPVFHRHKSILLDRIGDLTGAISHAQKSVVHGPKSAANHYHLANCLAKAKNWVAAISSSEAAVALANSNVKIVRGHCNILLQSGDLNGALFAIEQALEVTPDDAPLQRQRSIVLDRLGKVEAALEAAEKAVYLDPSSWNLQFHLSRLQAKLRYWDKAFLSALTAVDLAGPNVEITRHQIHVLVQAGRFLDALNIIEQGLIDFPIDPRLHKDKSVVLGKLGDLKDAVISAQTAVNLQIDNPAFQHHLSLSLGKAQRWGEALQVATVASRLAPQDAAIEKNRVTILSKLNVDGASRPSLEC